MHYADLRLLLIALMSEMKSYPILFRLADGAHHLRAALFEYRDGGWMYSRLVYRPRLLIRLKSCFPTYRDDRVEVASRRVVGASRP